MWTISHQEFKSFAFCLKVLIIIASKWIDVKNIIIKEEFTYFGQHGVADMNFSVL